MAVSPMKMLIPSIVESENNKQKHFWQQQKITKEKISLRAN